MLWVVNAFEILKPATKLTLELEPLPRRSDVAMEWSFSFGAMIDFLGLCVEIKELIPRFVMAMLALISAPLVATGQNMAKPSHATDKEDIKPPVIVVGFVGGFVGHDNLAHGPVQLAARLRQCHPSGVHVKVFENHRREDAHREILKLLDANHDGKISPEEKERAQIILYGVSWGGSETVALAKELDKEQIPVLLTVQVDSVAKCRQNDQVIPANVCEAANFYQPDGLIHGQSRIRAADEARTQILGNFRFDYKEKNVRCEKYPWYDKVFVKYHTEIECDPGVWSQVELLIRAKLPANSGSAPAN